ncbi:MAG: UvrB/UvrC motif-containing protein [Candidatus Omnitrophica bacterium]|nr:UvrB/UvrC motif-containing protein [Candidatus Omnitrophota bacterium]
MQCDICHKEEASVHLTEIIDNKVTKLHLCENCAREKSTEMEEHFGLADLLSGLADLVPVTTKKGKFPSLNTGVDIDVGIKCPGCGFTFQKFRKIGRLGCPNCYDAFRSQLSPLLRKIHGYDRHTGKTPDKKRVVKDATVLLGDLKARLAKAIEHEEFEEAARLRDQIRSIEKNDKSESKENTGKKKT